MSETATVVRSKTLAEQCYELIRRAIRDGKIPRRFFFSETTLAESLGVSRTPVREALLNLFRDGVVEIVPKRGYKLVELDDNDIDEIRLLRVGLEQIVVQRLSEMITPEQVEELRSICEGNPNTQNDLYSVDEAFHLRLAEMAGLKQIRQSLLSVRGKMYLIAYGTRLSGEANQQARLEHSQLIDALAAKDSQLANTIITNHIQRSIDAFVTARNAMPEQQSPKRLF